MPWVNIMELEYCKPERIRIKNIYNEKWLQDRIEEDPSLLGLGDINVVQRERRQSSGGRIDFLFLDSETQTMYEVEIMLGATNESHIIRTIEYWDIERRRFPSRDHKAVIVAEEITNRFFNVIALMNRSIPIIAIQVNALKISNSIVLDFVKVLDIYEPPEDEVDLELEKVDRKYWKNRSNPKSISIMDELISLIQQTNENTNVTYNKAHVAVGTTRRNFIWFHPRKKEGYCHFDVRVGKDNIDDMKDLLEGIGMSFTHRKEDLLSISLLQNIYRKNKEKISELIQISLEAYS